MIARSAIAKNLYKYQDASGAWVFTDRPPNPDIAAEVRPLLVQEQPVKVSIRNRGTPESARIGGDQRLLWRVLEVEISADALENMRAEPPLPARVIAPARAETVAVRLKPTGTRWRYGYRVQAVLGDPGGGSSTRSAYAPPFAPGQRFLITQPSRAHSAISIRKAAMR